MQIDKIFQLLALSMVVFGVWMVLFMYSRTGETPTIWWISLSLTLIVSGFIIFYLSGCLQNALELINKTEQIGNKQTHQPQIVITVMPNGINVQSYNLQFNDAVSILEISKLQIINGQIDRCGTNEIAKKP